VNVSINLIQSKLRNIGCCCLVCSE